MVATAGNVQGRLTHCNCTQNTHSDRNSSADRKLTIGFGATSLDKTQVRHWRAALHHTEQFELPRVA